MGILAQEVEPVAGPQIVGGAADGEGGPPLQAMDRDRTFDLVVVANLVPLSSRFVDLEGVRERPGG